MNDPFFQGFLFIKLNRKILFNELHLAINLPTSRNHPDEQSIAYGAKPGALLSITQDSHERGSDIHVYCIESIVL